MSIRTTEQLHDRADGLDALPLPDAAAHLFSGQVDALQSLQPALPDIARGAERMADAVRAGGRLFYAGAGSSGLMAAADAMELPGTFGIPSSRIVIAMAGGVPTTADIPGGTEDDVVAGRATGEQTGADDAAVVVTASGATPYAVAFAEAAQARGAATICLANNANAPLFEFADVSVCLNTPPEVIAGSTRMGAGTAQKAALNIMSTLMGIALGHVHDGMMVNVRADNDKLRDRAARMVARVASVDIDAARLVLDRASGQVKPAALMASGAATLEEAELLLSKSQDQLRAALARLKTPG